MLERPAPTAEQIFAVQAERERLRLLLLDQMRSHPVLLMPVSGIVAFKPGERKFDTGAKPIGMFQAMMTAVIGNVLGVPGLTVPVSVSPEGLPVGVQLLGRPWEEEIVLELGTKLEEARGQFPRPAA
jgi:Asp-tRNA(Asn)/Glu-tRNA(Gln) amidotransferase A subunit family amidase